MKACIAPFLLILLGLSAPGLPPSARAQAPLPLSADARPPPLFAVRLTKGAAWDDTKGPNEQAGMREHAAKDSSAR